MYVEEVGRKGTYLSAPRGRQAGRGGNGRPRPHRCRSCRSPDGHTFEPWRVLRLTWVGRVLTCVVLRKVMGSAAPKSDPLQLDSLSLDNARGGSVRQKVQLMVIWWFQWKVLCSNRRGRHKQLKTEENLADGSCLEVNGSSSSKNDMLRWELGEGGGGEPRCARGWAAPGRS